MAMHEFEGNEADRGFGERLTRKEQIIEVIVFLSLIVPTMILSYFITRQDGEQFAVLAWATILRDIALVALILFFVWRNGESTERVGWTARHEASDLLLGIVLFVPLFFLIAGLESLLRQLGLSGPSPEAAAALFPRTPNEFLLAILLVIVVAIAEEFIFRGYLIRRLLSATGSPAAAVLIAAVIFALGHGYQGGAGVITIGVVGVVFGLVYLWRGSLLAPVVMHFLQNFIGIVIFPYVTRQ